MTIEQYAFCCCPSGGDSPALGFTTSHQVSYCSPMAIMTALSEARFDDASFYLGDPNATFRELRDSDPVHWYEQGKFWVITKYDDIKMISARPEKFKSERIAIMMDLIANREGRDPQGYGGRGIMFMDPPEHRAHRKALGVRFTPSAVGKIESRVREVAASIFDSLPDGSSGSPSRSRCTFSRTCSVCRRRIGQRWPAGPRPSPRSVVVSPTMATWRPSSVR